MLAFPPPWDFFHLFKSKDGWGRYQTKPMTKFCGTTAFSGMISVDLHSWCGEWGLTEWRWRWDGGASWWEAGSEGSSILGGDGEWNTWKAVSPAGEEPLFLSAVEMGKARESTGRWLVFGAISLAKMSWPEFVTEVKGVFLLQQTAWEAPSSWNEF